jgi:ATP-dependent helicase HrpA
LQVEAGEINLRLFRQREEADAAHRSGLVRLLELQVLRELAWMEKDLRALSKWRNLYVIIGPVDELESFACENLKKYLFRFPGKIPITMEEFNAWVENVRKQIPPLTQSMVQRIGDILSMRHEVQLCKKPHAQIQEDLLRLAPRDFLQRIPYDRLAHLPRYLKAVLIRAERAAINPSKDSEKARRIQPYHEALLQVLAIKSPKRETAAKIYQYFWLLEEYRVSIFAQELGTAEPVSPKKLDGLLQEIKSGF